MIKLLGYLFIYFILIYYWMELFPPGKGCLNPPFIVRNNFVEVKHIFIISPMHQIVFKEEIFLGLLCLKFL